MSNEIFYQSQYNRSQFLEFLKGFLTDEFEEQVFDLDFETVSTKHINKVTKLAIDPGIDDYFQVWEVRHSGKKDPRVGLTSDIATLMKREGLDYVLCSIYSEDSQTWRLSLVTFDYQRDENGKPTIEISNPKRQSFLLGEGVKITTAKKQLSHSVPDLESLKKQFSLEALTNEFYDSLQNKRGEGLFKDLYSNLDLPPSSESLEKKKDFALLLIGRLLFCWFLKEKGWINEEVLNSNKVEELENQNQNYYHEILEKLFFETLNKEEDDRDLSVKELFSKTPYLNGGLFQPKPEKDYYRGGKTEIEDRVDWQLQVPNNTLKQLFKHFETFHFTIDENTSTEQEVGVDPEMMGRIFENFILNRSETGSFYTPREIVDYMVETGLLETLKKQFSLNRLASEDFGEYISRDDYDFLKLKNKLNRVYIIPDFLDGMNAKIPLRVIAKTRGWKYSQKTDSIEQISHRHKEVTTKIWQALDTKNFTHKETLLGNFKKVQISGKKYHLPTVCLILEIDDQEFAVFGLLKGEKNLEISTIFAVNQKKLKKLQKISQKNIKNQGFQETLQATQKNPSKRADLEYSRADATSPHTSLDFSSWQHRDKFSALQEYLRKILPHRPGFVKFGLDSNPIFDYLDELLYSNKHFISNQKIIDYLDQIKTLDPACGSGAFPIGLLQKMVELYHYLGDERSDYEIKKQILENSIFGVDLLPIAVEISRLRCWLSLVVDEDDQNPQALPNLEFKFVCANSLVGLDLSVFEKQVQDNLFSGDIDIIKDSAKKLREIRKKAFNPGVDKMELEKQWNQIIEGFHQEGVKIGAGKDESNQKVLQEAMKIYSWKPFKNEASEFFDPEWMFGISCHPELVSGSPAIGGFDLVIGNPPYIQLQSMSAEIKNLYKSQQFETYQATGDIYQLFYEKGVNLINQNGHLSYITSNKWMRAGYGKTTREFFATQTNPKIIIDLGANVFESATVDSNIIILQKAQNQGKTKATKASKQELEKGNPNFATINFDSSDGWFIGTPEEIALKKKIEENGKPLKDWDVKIYRGVLTGLNEAFIIDENKKNELIAKDPKSAEIIKPILRGRDIKRYGYEFAGLYVINSHNGYKNTPTININDYPCIKEHLDSFEPALSKRQDKGKTPYNLRNCAYLAEFEKEKVAWNRIASKKEFGLVDKNVFISDSMHFFTGIHLKYITAILNSKLLQFLLDMVIGEAAGGNAGNADNVAKLPIPLLDTPEKQQIAKKIEELVEEILLIKNSKFKIQNALENGESKKQKDTTNLESQIDDLVFDLYGLTDEERGLVLDF